MKVAEQFNRIERKKKNCMNKKMKWKKKNASRRKKERKSAFLLFVHKYFEKEVMSEIAVFSPYEMQILIAE